MFSLFVLVFFANLESCLTANVQMNTLIRTECYVSMINGKVRPVFIIDPSSESNSNNAMSTLTIIDVDVPQDAEAELNCQNVSSIDFESGKTYTIESAMNGLVIDLMQSLRSQKTPIITFINHGGINQRWIASHSQNARSFNLLTEVGVDNLLKEALTYDMSSKMTLLRHLRDGLSQQWYIGKQCSEFVQIQSDVLNMNMNCLTQMGNGMPLELKACVENDRNQLWRLNIHALTF